MNKLIDDVVNDLLNRRISVIELLLSVNWRHIRILCLKIFSEYTSMIVRHILMFANVVKTVRKRILIEIPILIENKLRIGEFFLLSQKKETKT